MYLRKHKDKVFYLLFSNINASSYTHPSLCTVLSKHLSAKLLEGGKIAHSIFKLPLNLIRVETPMCNISKQSNTAQVLKD